MNIKDNSILIWGAGKIGRGFVGDIFYQAGYDLTFVDTNKELVDKLVSQNQYTIYNVSGPGEEEKVVVKGYEAYHTDDKEIVYKHLMETSLMAVVVFPAAFEDTAKYLAEAIEQRAADSKPLDILVCANMFHPTKKFRELLEHNLSDEGKKYLEQSVGLIETLVMRMAIEPTPEMQAEDPLVVLTNGYPEMPVDQTAFKGKLPELEKLKYSDKIIAEEVRKMYTYNMVHAVFSYIGTQKGLQYVVECTQDSEVREIAMNTLDEVSQGLQAEYGFTAHEMELWNQRVMKNMSNPLLKDELNRVGGDPIRKLGRDDRLVGPALLCRKNGIMPYYLAKAIAGAFLFYNPQDQSCKNIREFMNINGIRESVRKYCQLEREHELTQLIVEHYKKALETGDIKEDAHKVEVLKKAYTLGFRYEITFKGCAQCALAATYELTGREEPLVFQLASGFSGGMAITGDGCCGGYTGGVMAMGSYVGRRLDKIPVDGDKVAQYKSYEMSQKLHDRFVETYGSVICADIHNEIFGKAYCLRTKEVRDEFEAAGAHKDKCTTVIAAVTTWIADLLLEEGFIK